MKELQELSRYLANRPAELQEAKKRGTKVVGYFPGEYIPEELIHASGAIPIGLIHGGEPKACEAALPVTTRFACAFSKAVLGERLLKRQPYYDLVDLVVVPTACPHLRTAADLWEYYTKANVFRVGIPLEYGNERELSYYIDMLWLLRERLEQLTGEKLTEDRVRSSIKLYNRMRELFREISSMRKASPPPITGLDFIRLNHASFYLDPAFMVDLLYSLSEGLKRKEARMADWRRPRLIMTGPNLAHGDYKIPKLIEEAGGTVVAEEFFEGLRSYWQDVELDGDPLQALAIRYLQRKLPSGYMRGGEKKRADFFCNLVTEFEAGAVIWYQLKFCETYDIESYSIGQRLEEKGIPMLFLESEYDFGDVGQLKTRLETLIFTLEEGE